MLAVWMNIFSFQCQEAGLAQWNGEGRASWIQGSGPLTPALTQVQKKSKVLASNGIIHIPTRGEQIPIYAWEGEGEDLAFIQRHAIP